MAFKQRTALDRSKRMYDDAATRRRLDEAALSSAPGGLQWQLGTQETGLKKRAADAHRNDLHQLNDFIEAATHKQKGDQAAIAAVKSIAETAIPKIGEHIAKQRKAKQENYTEDKYNEVLSKTTGPTSYSDPLIRARQANISFDKDQELKAGLETDFQITLDDGDSTYKAPTKEEREQDQNNSKSVVYIETGAKVNYSNEVRLTNQLSDPIEATEAFALFDDPRVGKYGRRWLAQKLIEDFPQNYLAWERTADVNITVKINGKDRVFNVQDLNRHNGPTDIATDLSPRYKQAAIDYYANNVLGVNITNAVGNAYANTYLHRALNKQVGTMQKEYRGSWAEQKNLENLERLEKNFDLALTNALEADKDTPGALAAFKATISDWVSDAQSFKRRLGVENPKNEGLIAVTEMIDRSINKRVSAGLEVDENAFMDIKIHKSQVPWVSPRFADENDMILMERAFPKEWTNAKFKKMIDDAYINKVKIEEASHQARAKDGYQEIRQLKTSGVDSDTLRTKTSIWLKDFGADFPELANKVKDDSYLTRNFREGYNWAMLQIKDDGYITQAQLDRLAPEAVTELKEKLGDTFEDFYFEVDPLERASATVKSNAVQGITDVVKTGGGLAEKTQIAGVHTDRVADWASTRGLIEEMKLIRVQQPNITGDEDLWVKTAGISLAKKIKDEAQNPESMWYVDSVKGYTKFESMLVGMPLQEDFDTAHIDRGHIKKAFNNRFNSQLSWRKSDTNMLVDPRYAVDFPINDRRYKLTLSGDVDRIWHEFAASKWNVATIEDVKPNGEKFYRKATANEIRMNFAEANKDTIKTEVLDPIDFERSTQDLRGRLDNFDSLISQRDNQKLCSRSIANAKNGPVYGTTKDAIRALKSLEPLSKLENSDLTSKWDKEALPFAIDYARKNGLKGSPKEVQRIAVAYLLGYNLEELDSNGHRAIWTKPEIEKWHNIACAGGLP